MQRRIEYLRGCFYELDRLLRGEATRPDAIAERSLQVSARGLAILSVLLAMFYGACMGSYSLLKARPDTLDDPFGPFLQVIASTVKTPALFFLTLMVTLPSLYVSNALIGSRLTPLGMSRLLVASVSVNLAVLASLGTIVLFFSLTTTSYSFVVLLNVAAFSLAGVLGLMFLLQTLHRVLSCDEPPDTTASPPENAPGAEPADPAYYEPNLDAAEAGDADAPSSPLDMPSGQMLGRHTRVVFRCWLVLFSLVGAQMGWVLRPFIGHPDLAFSFFRAKESNFFSAVWGALWNVLTGGA